MVNFSSAAVLYLLMPFSCILLNHPFNVSLARFSDYSEISIRERHLPTVC